MTFLPIVDRALRVQARRKQTYSARVRIALSATLLGGGAMVAYNACGCLVALPAAMIFVPLGKAQPGELVRVMLALANTLFLSLNAGLLVSALSRKQQRARIAASLLILVFWLVLPGLAEWLRRSQFSPSLYLPLQVLSPTGTYPWAIDPAMGMRTNHFWLSLTSTHLLAWVFLAAACWTLP